jgi:hypothetical protein
MDMKTEINAGQKLVYGIFVVLLIATLFMSHPMPN